MRAPAAYLALSKPGITLFIGVTAAAGYVTASRGWGSPGAFAATLGATMLMSGGAAAMNQVAESRWDASMRRTSSRPIPSGAITPRSARRFARILTASGLLLSLALLPLPTAAYLVMCHASYVWLYTPLKRRTPLCTLAGAIPGALPVLAGWSAAGRPIDVTAVALTGVLFMWQIPHFLAIGWIARVDYERVGCPMLGVVEPSGRASARVSLVYACAMLVCAAVVAMDAALGPAFLVGATVTGAGYVGFAWSFARDQEAVSARRLFFSSLLVLPLILGALVTDLTLP